MQTTSGEGGAYPGRQVALLTQHGKERVIAAALEPALGCRVERVAGYDTDLLGTFTRDIPREGTKLEAARSCKRPFPGRRAGIQDRRAPCGRALRGLRRAHARDPRRRLRLLQMRVSGHP